MPSLCGLIAQTDHPSQVLTSFKRIGIEFQRLLELRNPVRQMPLKRQHSPQHVVRGGIVRPRRHRSAGIDAGLADIPVIEQGISKVP